MLRRGFLAGLLGLSAGSLALFLNFFNPRGISGFGRTRAGPRQSVAGNPVQTPFICSRASSGSSILNPGDGVPEAFESVAPASAQRADCWPFIMSVLILVARYPGVRISSSVA